MATLLTDIVDSTRQVAVPGIYGGMGPLSHIKFEEALMRANREATSDQQSPVYWLVNGAHTPDRTKDLMSGSTEAARHMIATARHFERIGVDFIVVICNTAHAFHPQVQSAVSVPWVHMIDQTAAYTRRHFDGLSKVGVLATDGTLLSQLYHHALRRHGITPVSPALGSDEQSWVMEAIYDPDNGIKATGTLVNSAAREKLTMAADWCRRQGAQALIAGCTEISIGLTPGDYRHLPIIDPLKVMADLTIDLAFGKRHLDDVV